MSFHPRISVVLSHKQPLSFRCCQTGGQNEELFSWTCVLCKAAIGVIDRSSNKKAIMPLSSDIIYANASVPHAHVLHAIVMEEKAWHNLLFSCSSLGISSIKDVRPFQRQFGDTSRQSRTCFEAVKDHGSVLASRACPSAFIPRHSCNPRKPGTLRQHCTVLRKFDRRLHSDASAKFSGPWQRSRSKEQPT